MVFKEHDIIHIFFRALLQQMHAKIIINFVIKFGLKDDITFISPQHQLSNTVIVK